MEQQRTRTQPPRPRGRASDEGGPRPTVPGPAAPSDPAGRGRLRLPRARRRPEGAVAGRGAAAPSRRLTAVGTGVATVAATAAGAVADRALLGGPGVLFGLVYVAVCFQVAVRVRPADLAAAPISGPIAFALALLATGHTSGRGVGGHVVGLAAGLATRAGWLFAGTGLAAAITAARWVALRRSRGR
ncbi:hypothetical protein LO771_26260 [Streptacidiphilus sp. ASG 303]|uniref:DUF6542 domain-containing protein n=1 Tax=Streptacidiphilus sp. ASG 303 TaxID=2896847 RepID=UPI001E46CD91|nr:DUF6542 domain-containing protein [Streptacidiphilus sp. ASG 303]MCD0485799.1 hypothetical protein [Streptacidiphilus sp. ASG 303]